MIPNKILKTLEYDKIMEKIASFAVLDDAKLAFAKITPTTKYEEALYLQELTNEGDRALSFYNSSLIANFDNCDKELDKAAICSVLSIPELLKLNRLLKSSRYFKHSIESLHAEEIPKLNEMASNIYTNTSIENELDNSIISDDELADDASNELRSIRRNIKRCNDNIRDHLQGYIRNPQILKYLQDALITTRGGRFVIPVKAECKQFVPGIVHDQSSSGQTVFIEPMQVVELNNNLSELIISEKREIERILKYLTQLFTNCHNALRKNEEILVKVDIIYAKVQYGYSIKAKKPELNNYGYTHIINGRHPLIDPKVCVPITVWVGKDFNILLVTGPNTGGKTVSLKTVGLFSLLATSGVYLPASDGTKVSVYDCVYCDVGDEQSIEQSLSTFSSHIKNIASIMNHATSNSLILIDEIGAGTDPIEGAALGKAILNNILNLNAKAIITTHYSELKEYALVTPNIENTSMEFNEETLAPSYKLLIGIPGSSNALNIAKRLGLKKEIIDNARSYISGEKISFESILQHAEKVRQKAEKDQEKINVIKSQTIEDYNIVKKEKERIEKQKENAKVLAKQEAKEIIYTAKEEANEIIKKLKEKLSSQELSDKDLFEARALANKLDREEEKERIIEVDIDERKQYSIEDIKVGMYVFSSTLNADCTVLAIEKNGKIKVQYGSATVLLPVDDLYQSFKDDSSKNVKMNIATSVYTSNMSDSINLHGQNLDEAIYNLDYFINKAIIAKLETIFVVHGKGTGVLRSGIQNYLKHDKRVVSFRNGRYGEGDYGVTVVTLKV